MMAQVKNEVYGMEEKMYEDMFTLKNETLVRLAMLENHLQRANHSIEETKQEIYSAPEDQEMLAKLNSLETELLQRSSYIEQQIKNLEKTTQETETQSKYREVEEELSRAHQE